MRSTGAIVLLVVLLVVGFAGCSGCGTYNSLVKDDEQVDGRWADVQAQYQRRENLIDNLVNTVKGQAGFESETLQRVTEARSRAGSVQLNVDDLDDPAAVQRFQEAQTQLNESLSGFGRILSTSEAYPQLQANQGFLNLQSQLEGTENRIATSIRDYNAAVAGLNGRVRSFPGNLVAGFASVDRRTPFAAAPGSEVAPEVNFGN